jgi:hypothetical protein
MPTPIIISMTANVGELTRELRGPVTEEDQRAKLALIVNAAKAIWH